MNQKMPGAHKIGAAISGPRIAGRNFMGITGKRKTYTGTSPCHGEKMAGTNEFAFFSL